MKAPSDALRAFFAVSTRSWPKLRALARKLAADDLAEAERIERLGERRVNVLLMFRAERNLRAGEKQKMTKLRVNQ